MSNNNHEDKLKNYLHENAPKVPTPPKDELQQIYGKLNIPDENIFQKIITSFKWTIPATAALILLMYFYIGDNGQLQKNIFSEQELIEIIDDELYANGNDYVGEEWLEFADQI